MYEVHWTTHTLLVSIPDSSTTYEQSAFTNSISYWNQAQTCFVQSYYPHDYPRDVFTLQLATQGQTAQVTVQYVSKSLGSSNNGVQIGGLTSNYGTRISILINSGPYPFAGVVAEHELGHVLGLGDNSVANDLMYFPSNQASATGAAGADFPSTLDLYAVFAKAKCVCYSNGDTLSLPSNIPFISEAWNPWHPPAVIPEFPNSLLLLVAVISASLMLSMNRRRVPTCNSQKHVPKA